MMHRLYSLAPLALTALLAVAGATPSLAEGPPPVNLRQVGDHWTAWEPPTSFPDGTQVYTIAAGDTLWDLASRFYGDPYLWPQLWETNSYILDAHWIYPGDPLVIGSAVTEVEDLSQLGDGEDAGTIPGEGAAGEEAGDGLVARPDAGPVPLGTESDIYCSGFVGELDEEFPFMIVGSEHEALGQQLSVGARSASGRWGTVDTARYGMADGDIVYVSGGRDTGLAPGDVFMVVEASQDPMVHPLSGEVFGRLYRYTGRLRVLSVQQETAIGEIVHSCDGVVVGSFLEPFEQVPVPLARRTMMRPANLPVEPEELQGAPTILWARDDIVSLGADHVVWIDQGADAVTPGDIFTIYRMHQRGFPPVIIGELAVLSVHPRSSVAKIINNRYTVFIGDRLDLK